MRKMVKALALALALCMVLSVSAFAANSVTDTPAVTDRVITFTVDQNHAVGDQVALLIVDSNATLATLKDEQICYIDQRAADADGKVAFAAPIAEGKDLVDIYIGSSRTGGAEQVIDNFSLAGAVDIQIVAGSQVIADPGASQIGAALQLNIVKNAGEDLEVIWSIGKKGESAKVYSEKQTLTGTNKIGDGSTIWLKGFFGKAELEAAFKNVNLKGEGAEAINANFKFEDLAAEDINLIIKKSATEQIYTDVADAANKANS